MAQDRHSELAAGGSSAGPETTPQTSGDSGLRRLALGTAAKGLVHEIVNPVNVVLMNAELALLCLDNDDRDEVAEALAVIVKEAKRVGEMASRFNDFAQANGYTPGAAADLTEVVGEARKLLGSAPSRQGVELTAGGADGCYAPANRTALAVAVAGLVRAAIDAGARRIAVAVNDAKTAAEISVCGDAGVSPSTAEAVWALDLRLAERVIDGHRGTLLVDEPSSGWRLTMRLPKSIG